MEWKVPWKCPDCGVSNHFLDNCVCGFKPPFIGADGKINANMIAPIEKPDAMNDICSRCNEYYSEVRLLRKKINNRNGMLLLLVILLSVIYGMWSSTDRELLIAQDELASYRGANMSKEDKMRLLEKYPRLKELFDSHKEGQTGRMGTAHLKNE
ncbi:MAG: hypothetical protein ACE5EB_08565 [Thermodesulfobacteriota bacterium]